MPRRQARSRRAPKVVVSAPAVRHTRRSIQAPDAPHPPSQTFPSEREAKVLEVEKERERLSRVVQKRGLERTQQVPGDASWRFNETHPEQQPELGISRRTGERLTPYQPINDDGTGHGGSFRPMARQSSGPVAPSGRDLGPGFLHAISPRSTKPSSVRRRLDDRNRMASVDKSRLQVTPDRKQLERLVRERGASDRSMSFLHANPVLDPKHTRFQPMSERTHQRRINEHQFRSTVAVLAD